MLTRDPLVLARVAYTMLPACSAYIATTKTPVHRRPGPRSERKLQLCAEATRAELIGHRVSDTQTGTKAGNLTRPPPSTADDTIGQSRRLT